MARLVVETGQEAGMVYPIGSHPLTIGRSVNCGIQVMDRRVSRKHAVIKWVNGACVLEDLDSRNGTYLNHQPLKGLAQLRSGDRIAVGGSVLLFEVDPEEEEDARARLRRVRFAPGGDENYQAEKSVTSDTEPLITQAPVSRETMGDPVQRLRVLYQVSESLRAELNLDTLLTKIMDILWMVVAPDRGIILIADESDGQKKLAPAVVKVRDDEDDEGDIIISQGIIDRSLNDKSAILMTDAPSDVRFSENHSVMSGAIRSAICTPLIANGISLGVIYIDTRDTAEVESHSFSNEDLDMVSGISVQAALAIQNARLHHETLNHQRLERELEIAREIQMGLLPQAKPQMPGLDFAARCIPARQVGGDYYDYIPMADNRLAIVIADASGKGVPAAILISMVRAICRARALDSRPEEVDSIVTAINSSMCSDAQNDNFASLFMMVYDPQKAILRYTNAGHVPPLLIRESGEIVRLGEGGPLLGVSTEVYYPRAEIAINSGDTVVLYTDGVTDTHNLFGRMYTENRLIEEAMLVRTRDAETICDSIYRSVIQFRESNEPFDDLTLLVVKVE